MPPLFFLMSFPDSSCLDFGSGVFGSGVLTVRLMAVYSIRPFSVKLFDSQLDFHWCWYDWKRGGSLRRLRLKLIGLNPSSLAAP